MIAQANYVRVRVNRVEGLPEGMAPPQRELLCIVRALLKKIKQRVLVGDFVEVSSIDWTDARGAARLRKAPVDLPSPVWAGVEVQQVYMRKCLK